MTVATKREPRSLAQDAAAQTVRELVVLDTSVLVFDPESLFGFGMADVVIPLVVIEELDGLKTRPDDVGRAARAAIRSIEALRVCNGGDIRTPVPLPSGGTLRVETNGLHLDTLRSSGLSADAPDNRILATGLGLATGVSDGVTVRVESNDAALRIKAAQLGLGAREYRRRREDDGRGTWLTTERSGWRALDVPANVIERLYSQRLVEVESVRSEIGSLGAPEVSDEIDAAIGGLRENEFVVVRGPNQSGLSRHCSGRLHLLHGNRAAWGLHPRSKEQRFALELLLDPEVTVVALDGVAGTGKTVLGLAAGLEQTVESSSYETFSVYRPVVPVGRSDVGYLPGALDEKLGPWMAAILDAVTALTERDSHDDARRVVEHLTSRGTLTMESVTFLRGRSIQDTFVLVDEAQNLEPTTLKTILTRVGEGTKVVFTGDTSQIDAPYLSEVNNALSVLVDAFGGQSCFGHVRLTACERSDVADLAARLL